MLSKKHQGVCFVNIAQSLSKRDSLPKILLRQNKMGLGKQKEVFPLRVSVIIQTQSVFKVWQRCANKVTVRQRKHLGHGRSRAICIFAKTVSCNSSRQLNGKEAHE